MSELLTKEVYDRWIKPQEALARVAGAGQDWERAARDILRRVSAGKIDACAEDVRIRRGGQSGQLAPYSRLPEGVIRAWTKSGRQAYLEFWKSANGDADVVVSVSSHGMLDGQKHYELFGIRFDPDGIRALTGEPLKSDPNDVVALGQFGQVPPADAGPVPAVATDEPGRRKPVSDAALKIWADAFAKIHKGENVAQPLALKSAEGMFPDKVVSRDRITAALKTAGVTFHRGPRRQISGE